VIYEKGYGVNPDKSKSNKFYQTACDNNISKACYNLAIQSTGTLSSGYYLKAANLGHAKSQFEIAKIYQYENNDSNKALIWFKEAAINKNTDAMFEYAKLLKKDGNSKSSQYWLDRAQKEMR